MLILSVIYYSVCLFVCLFVVIILCFSADPSSVLKGKLYR